MPNFEISIQSTIVQSIPAYMRLRISIGNPNFVLPNLDSVNHCTSKEISMEIKRYLLVQWLTESRFVKTKFSFPIEIRSLMSTGIGCTSKEMPNLDSVNHCTIKTESRFGISKFGIPIEIRSLMSAGIGCSLSASGCVLVVYF